MSAKLRKALGRLLGRKGSRVDIETLAVSMLEEFGGAQMLAKEYKKLYDNSAGKSPMTQQKVLMMIQQLVHATTIHNLAKPPDFSSWSQADIDELMGLYLERVDRGPAEDEADTADESPGGADADDPAGRDEPGEATGDPAAA